MKCVLCGHIFNDSDTGYVRGSIAGEVIELLPCGLKGTAQEFDHKGVIFCISHFEDIPKHIAENLKANAANRKEKS